MISFERGEERTKREVEGSEGKGFVCGNKLYLIWLKWRRCRHGEAKERALGTLGHSAKVRLGARLAPIPFIMS